MPQVKKSSVTILIVDDDPDVLQYLEDIFEEEYHVIACPNGVEALKTLNAMDDTSNIAIILSDHMMPGMNGLQFVRETRGMIPLAKRLLMTGQSIPDVIVDAINKGDIYRYIQKPIDDELILAEVATCYKSWCKDLENEWLLGEVNKLNRNLETKVQQKVEQTKALLRIVCHDVSNPLAVVLGNTAIMQKLYKDDKASKYLKKIEKGATMLANIIDEVRQSQSIEDGKLIPKLASCSLHEVIEDICFMFEDRMKKKSIQFELDIDPNHRIYSDISLLKTSIIGNIVSNAIKFSERNSKIQISSEEIGEAIALEIRDHGIGMPSSLLNILFSSTAQTSRSGTQGEEGTGFGMPIVKAAIEACKGHIKVLSKEKTGSEQDHGTTITISFPKEEKVNQSHITHAI